jgi:hypothetical protein
LRILGCGFGAFSSVGSHACPAGVKPVANVAAVLGHLMPARAMKKETGDAQGRMILMSDWGVVR